MGTELDIDNTDLELENEDLETELKDTEPKDEDKEKEWDKTRQDLDFERANARKARAELETMTEAYEQANTRLNELQEQISELKDAKQNEQDRLDEMDPDLVDASISKNIQTLERRLAQKEQQLSAINKKIEDYEKAQADAETKRRNEEARETVFTTVEDVLVEAGIQAPGKYRNEANKLADHMVDRGEAKQPRTLADAVKLMTKCYLQVKKEQESKSKSKSKGVSVDTGKAGTTPAKPAETGIKPGRLSDIKAQMLKDQSWKG